MTRIIGLILLVVFTLLFVTCNEDSVIDDVTSKDKLSGKTIVSIDTLAPTVTMKHNGAYYTQADIDRAKANLTIEPWLGGWEKLINNSHAQTSYIAHPTVKLIRGGNSPEEPDPDNYSHAMNDAAAAFQLGIRWKITGDNLYAQAAVNIFKVKVVTMVPIAGGSTS